LIPKVNQFFLSFFCTIQFYLENPYSWLISSPKKSFIVRANSDRERQEWLAHLERCIRSASGMYRTIISIRFSLFVFFLTDGNNTQLNTVAAHWVPDDRSDTCMHCHVTKFSTYNRKHV
jgi:hypothetical protein